MQKRRYIRARERPVFEPAQLGSTTAVILLVLAVGVVVGSSWLARRLGGNT